MSQSTRRFLRRQATREGVKAGTIAPAKRNLNPEEILELQEIARIERTKAFEANQIRMNTAMLPSRGGFWPFSRGKKEIVAEAEALAHLFKGIRIQWIRDRLPMCGYPADFLCEINFGTGEITAIKDEA